MLAIKIGAFWVVIDKHWSRTLTQATVPKLVVLSFVASPAAVIGLRHSAFQEEGNLMRSFQIENWYEAYQRDYM